MRILLYKEVTMEEEPEYNEDDQISETERLKIEHLMLETAYENSYKVLTGKITFSELLDEKDILGLTALMAYDPAKGIKKHELESMIEFYVERDDSEYYLRCAELKKILDETPN